MSINPWITNNFIDSCAFDPKYHPEDQASIEIFRLHKEQDLGLKIAHSNQKEIEHPNTPSWVKNEALSLIFTIEVSLTKNERALYNKILLTLAGNGKRENMTQDAKHIFEAQKYGSYFVTTDARLLKKAASIKRLCKVEVLEPSNFLELLGHYGENSSHNDSVEYRCAKNARVSTQPLSAKRKWEKNT